MQKDHIITVSYCKFQLGGYDFPVNTCELHLALNTMPYYVVTFPPHVFSSKGYDIQNPGLKDVEQIMTAMYNMATKSTKASLSIILEDSEAKQRQGFRFIDWILGDVSIGTVSTVQGFVIACKIFHPAYNLLKYGYFAGSLDQPLDLSVIGRTCADLVDAADVVINDLTTAQLREPSQIDMSNVPHASNYKAVQTKIKQLVQQLASKAKPSDYLKVDPSFDDSFSYTNKPLTTLVARMSSICDGQSAISLAMCSSFMPSENCSVWDSFISACGLWGCSIIPDYRSQDNKLVVFPISPWGKPSYFIPEGRVYSMTLPAYDGNPVLGVKCSASVFGSDEGGSTQPIDDPVEDTTQAEMVYIPEGNLESLTGRIQPISMPPWLSVLQQAAASLRECVVDGKTTEKDQVNAGASGDSLMNDIYSAWVKYAAYVFQLGHKQTYTASMTMPLYTFTEGKGDKKKYLLPGLSLRVMSKGKGVIDGYIEEVHHRLNIDSGNGTTTVTFSHCRPPGGYKGVAEEGDANPLYK